ncbi:hypothetical protein BGX31_006647, partial [Mortierella sp. GBA43]
MASPGASDPTTSSTTHSKASAICDRTSDLSGTSAESPVDDNTIGGLDITVCNGGKQVVEIGHKDLLGSVESTFEQRLVAFLPADMQTQVLGSSDVHEWMVQAIRGGQADRLNEQLIACLQHLKDEIIKNNELAFRNNELAFRNNELASRNNELASKNNEMACDIKDLALRNNEM